MSLLLVIPFLTLAQNRDVELYTEKLAEMMTLFQSNISSEDKCEELWHDVRDYKEEIDEFRSKGEFTRGDSETLLGLSSAADMFADYFICVGGWNCYPIKKGRFFKASDFFDDVQISYVSKDVYCIDIIEYRLGDFKAYFLINNTTKNYRASYSLAQTNAKRSGNRGLAAGAVAIMIDNREEPISNYKIVDILCQEY